jgi:hypothetical protein
VIPLRRRLCTRTESLYQRLKAGRSRARICCASHSPLSPAPDRSTCPPRPAPLSSSGLLVSAAIGPFGRNARRAEGVAEDVRLLVPANPAQGVHLKRSPRQILDKRRRLITANLQCNPHLRQLLLQRRRQQRVKSSVLVFMVRCSRTPSRQAWDIQPHRASCSRICSGRNRSAPHRPSTPSACSGSRLTAGRARPPAASSESAARSIAQAIAWRTRASRKNRDRWC